MPVPSPFRNDIKSNRLVWMVLIAGMLFIGAHVISVGASESADSACTLKYSPAVVELSGEIVTKIFYGAPGFGENPQSDAKEKVYLLKLDRRIAVAANANDETQTSSYQDIGLVQLDSDSSVVLHIRELVGKRVVATGVLDAATTGHQHTEIVFSLNDLRAGSYGEKPVCNLSKEQNGER
jgi:hypothetical protein